MWGATVYQDPDETLKQIAFEKSIKRLKYKLDNKQTIHYNEVSNILIKAIKNSNKISDFLNTFGYIYESILVPYQIDFKSLMGHTRFIIEDTVISSKLFAFFKIIQELMKSPHSNISNLPFISSITDSINHHTLGPIGIAISELGRWTSIGGQGVMINELSQGLVTLGQNVFLVTPYYHLNRRNESNYLEDDKDFKHTLDFQVKVGGETYTINLFEGKVNGVTIYFIKNTEIFTSVSAQGDGVFTLKQICVFAKAVLEVFCVKRMIPSLIITNDWFTGLVPAYAKNNFFGDVFNGTKFLHLIHNLDIMYDGRIHLTHDQGVLFYIYF